MSKLSTDPQNQRAYLVAGMYTHHHTHVEPAIAEQVTA